jgi:hypothetical protein
MWVYLLSGVERYGLHFAGRMAPYDKNDLAMHLLRGRPTKAASCTTSSWVHHRSLALGYTSSLEHHAKVAHSTETAKIAAALQVHNKPLCLRGARLFIPPGFVRAQRTRQLSFPTQLHIINRKPSQVHQLTSSRTRTLYPACAGPACPMTTGTRLRSVATELISQILTFFYQKEPVGDHRH